MALDQIYLKMMQVVVAGAFDDNLIIATELQTKCASRYEGDLKNIEKI